MNVLSVLSSASAVGGSSKAFYLLAKELVNKKNVSLTVVAPSEGGIIPKLKNLGVNCFYVPVRYSVWPACSSLRDIITFIPRLVYNHVVNMVAIRKVLRIAKSCKPDLIHSNVGVIDVGIKCAKILHIPHIYHLREFQLEDFSMRIMPNRKKYLESLKHAISNVIYITRSIENVFHLDDKFKNNKAIIYDGIERTTDNACIEKKRTILFVGRLTEKKGIFEVIEAFGNSKAVNMGFSLHLVGPATPDELQLVKKNIRDRKADAYISLLGIRNDVDVIMRESYALIMASESEAFGLVTAEAMMNKCLVIGKNIAGTKEQFDNGFAFIGEEIGFRYENLNELIARIDEVCCLEYNKYQQMTNRAFETVTSLYSKEKHVDEVFGFFQKVIMDYENRK